MASVSAAPLFISESDVRGLVTMTDLVEVLGPAFRSFSAGVPGDVIQPVRTAVPVDDHNGSVAAKLHAASSVKAL